MPRLTVYSLSPKAEVVTLSESSLRNLAAHGGDCQRIEWVAMDMLHCYAKGVREHFARAQIVYDRFHLMVIAGEAVDEVRRSLQRQGARP